VRETGRDRHRRTHNSPGNPSVPFPDPNPSKQLHLPVPVLHIPCPEHSASNFVPAGVVTRVLRNWELEEGRKGGREEGV
jgi:hypothetical protein